LSDTNVSLSPDKYTYRVEFIEDTARVQCFGVPIHACAEFEEETVLPIAELPDWMTRRVAVLCTMSYEPPTEFVNKIGRRISEHVYWIFYEGDEDDDTREES
jgi:hypothetical protein